MGDIGNGLGGTSFIGSEGVLGDGLLSVGDGFGIVWDKLDTFGSLGGIGSGLRCIMNDVESGGESQSSMGVKGTFTQVAAMSAEGDGCGLDRSAPDCAAL